MKKLAIFDFCGTIVPFQSADLYCSWVYERFNGHRGLDKGLLNGSLRKLSPFSRYLSRIKKKRQLLSLRGCPQDCMIEVARDFFTKSLVPNFISEILGRISAHRQEGSTLVLISGGYDVYLTLVKEHLDFDYLICSKLKFENGVFTGETDGEDCMGEHKVLLLKKALNLNEYDVKGSFVYTDSLDDMPLVRLVGHSVYVNTKGRKVPTGFNEAIQYT